MNSVSPTARQLDLLRFIAGYQRAHCGASPSMQECAAGIGLASKSNIHRYLIDMEERGLIKHGHTRHRDIRLRVPVAVPTAPDGQPLRVVPLPRAITASIKPRRLP